MRGNLTDPKHKQRQGYLGAIHRGKYMARYREVLVIRPHQACFGKSGTNCYFICIGRSRYWFNFCELSVELLKTVKTINPMMN